jgi:hypothetical protein
MWVVLGPGHLGISHTWLQKLVREFKADPIAMWLDSYIANHPYRDQTFVDGKNDKLTKHAARKPGDPSPLDWPEHIHPLHDRWFGVRRRGNRLDPSRKAPTAMNRYFA